MDNFIDFINNISLIWFSFISKQVIISVLLFIIISGIIICLKRKYIWFQFGLFVLLYLRLVLPPNFAWKLDIGQYFQAKLIQSSPIDFAVTVQPNNFIDDYSQTRIVTSPLTNQALLSEHNTEFTPSPLTEIKNESKKASLHWLVVSLFLAWFVGLSYTLTMIIQKIRQLKNYQKNISQIDNAKILYLVEKWRSKLKIKSPVNIFTGKSIPSPFTTGIFKPKIFFPEKLIHQLNFDEIEPIIAHELVHIKRKDLIFQKFQMIINVVYFFNPVIWFSNSRLNQLREQMCDTKVIELSEIKPKFYSQVLLKVLNQKISTFEYDLCPVVKFGDHKNKIKRRIQTMLNLQRLNRKNLFFTILSISLMCVFFFSLGFKNSGTNIKTISGIHPYQKIPFELRIIEEGSNTFSGLMKYNSDTKPAWSYVEGTYGSHDSLFFQEKLFFLGFPFSVELLDTDGFYKGKIDKYSFKGLWSHEKNPYQSKITGKVINKGPALSNIENEAWELLNQEKSLLIERKKLDSEKWEQWASYIKTQENKSSKKTVSEIRVKRDSLYKLLSMNGFKLLQMDYPFYNKYKSGKDSSLVKRHFISSIMRCAHYVSPDHFQKKKEYLSKIIREGDDFFLDVQYMVLGLPNYGNIWSRDDLSRDEKERIVYNKRKQKVLNIDENKLSGKEIITYLYQLSNTCTFSSGKLTMKDETFKQTVFDKIERLQKRLPKNEYNQYHINRILWGINDPINYSRLKMGTPAPNFEFKNEAGDILKLSSLRGNVVYILFWQKFNSPDKLLHLKQVAKNINNKNFKIIYVFIDQYEEALKYCGRHEIPWNPIRPVNQMNSDISNMFVGETAIGFLIDKNGIIRARRNPGFEELESRIRKYL